MKLLKSIDLYGKLPKGLAETTSFGALMSVITMIFLGLMIFSEFIEYITIDVNSDIVVDESRSKDMISINMDIKFIRAPCDFLELDAYDIMGQVLPDKYKMLIYYRLDSSENVIGVFKNEQFDVEAARKGVAEKQGCQVTGYVKVSKVQGRLQFGPHRSHHYIPQVGNLNFPLDYSHKILSMSFGEEIHLRQVKRQFSQGQLEALSKTQRVKRLELVNTPVFLINKQMQHEHYISVVSTSFTLLNKKQYNVFQYTANHNEVRAQYYPQVYFRYDFSPITVNFWQTKEDYKHFLVQICAVIGGIFTVAGMIESAISNIVKFKLH